MKTKPRLPALMLLLECVPASAQVAVTDDRDGFIAGTDVAYIQDFESFFAPGATFAGANFGASSSGFFLPLVYRATDDGTAQLYGTEFHSGDSVAASIRGDAADAIVELGGLYRAVGLDLLRSLGPIPRADVYEITLLREGNPIASPVTALANSFVGLTAEDPFDAFRLHASTSDTTPAIEIFDNIVAGAAFGGPCGPADLVEPFGLLDLADIGAFVTAFPAMDPLADLAPPFGLLDLADIGAFIGSFTGGCP